MSLRPKIFKSIEIGDFQLLSPEVFADASIRKSYIKGEDAKVKKFQFN